MIHLELTEHEAMLLETWARIGMLMTNPQILKGAGVEHLKEVCKEGMLLDKFIGDEEAITLGMKMKQVAEDMTPVLKAELEAATKKREEGGNHA